jgi:signal transduction histidine kinase
MLNRLYDLLIRPKQKDEDLQNREMVLNVLLIGTLVMLACTILLFLFSYGPGHNCFMLARLLYTISAFFIACLILYLSRSGYHRLASWLFIIIYMFLASVVVACWGASLPSAALLFGFVIMLIGVVLGSSYPIYGALASTAIITALNIAANKNILRPDLDWASDPLNFGTVSGAFLMFGVIALVSWLSNERTEGSLRRAHRAEEGLRRQKLLLESKVEERTQELQAAQFEKIQQLYRFAELGQLSTALMHDLANHLTTLTIDIEGLETENHSAVLKRAKRSIRYVDDMVMRVRDQLNGKIHDRPFDVVSETQKVINILTHRASESNVALTLDVRPSKQELRCKGDSIRFRQLMANMITNGVDAYNGMKDSQRREVKIAIELTGGTIIITVTDWGKGINATDRQKLFEPFYSTKQTGMGMGLFIAKQIAEENFRGNISLDSTPGQTNFIITLARN